ncbi:MAG: aldehyde:ferredoxin oxidoreductase, partial [Desulfobacterales bacterium]|nr:aldehyde:ferredoxin oxidoreductase [Desulfobacterales bacterium]
PTKKYERWVGGHGMGAAIFFDLVKDKSIDGFHPSNTLALMTSPLSGTLAPASARTEIVGIGVQSYPIGWFTRSNFGGRFSGMLKYAGWDGVVIRGASDKRVWLDIRDDQVKIRECGPFSLWGTDTWECQRIIREYVVGKGARGGWAEPTPGGGRTTQTPAVLAIGPAGENRSRMACLIHDAGAASGQGGFGGVFGAKGLKAISVLGAGAIEIKSPGDLMDTRLWQKENYAFDLKNPIRKRNNSDFRCPPSPGVLWGRPPGSDRPKGGQRPSACAGCHSGCRGRYESGMGNEATCVATFLCPTAPHEVQHRATDLVNMYGINAYEIARGLRWLRSLHKMGALGPNKGIACDLDFDNVGSVAFFEGLLRKVAFREDPFGDVLAEGFVRAADKWGRLEGDKGDLKTGLLTFPYWGLPEHGYDPRAELEWGYGSILGDRDINEHCFNKLYWDPTLSAIIEGMEPQASAEEAVRIYSDKLVPYDRDPDRMLMLDFSSENMYSEHMAKLVSWHRHYTRFWKQSVLYCDWKWPDFLNLEAPGKIGSSVKAEPEYLKAVTGKSIDFARGVEKGREIWNLDNAIWTLQGRHRDMVHFADYIYTVPMERRFPYIMPGRKDGKWEYIDLLGRKLDKGEFEKFKTRFYKREGWDPATGWPEKNTLAALGLDAAADELEKNKKLGG